MILGYVGTATTFALLLSDRAVGKFPRARVFTSAGAQVTGSPFDLSAVAAYPGLYVASWTPGATGHFSAVFDVYDDAPHTILSGYDPAEEDVVVLEADPLEGIENVLGSPNPPDG